MNTQKNEKKREVKWQTFFHRWLRWKTYNYQCNGFSKSKKQQATTKEIDKKELREKNNNNNNGNKRSMR